MNIRTISDQLLSVCRCAIFGEPLRIDAIDLDALYSLAYRHDLDGTLFYALSDALGQEKMPPNFEQAHARLRHRTIADDEQRQRLFRLLDQEKIPVIYAPTEHLRLVGGERLYRTDISERLFVAPEDAERLFSLLISKGFECVFEETDTRVYLHRPCFFLKVHFGSRASLEAFNAAFTELYKRATPADGFSSVYQMSPTDAYVFLLSDLLSHIADHGVKIRDALEVAQLHRYLGERASDAALREMLREGQLDSLEAVLLSLYRTWIEGEAPSAPMKIVSDLTLARGLYDDFEDYLWENSKQKPLAYTFLPYSEMRVAHPFCKVPVLYPIAALLRVFHLARRRADKEPCRAPKNAYSLTLEQNRALWRAVGVILP